MSLVLGLAVTSFAQEKIEVAGASLEKYPASNAIDGVVSDKSRWVGGKDQNGKIWLDPELEQSGVTGGLIVHVGCGDGKRTAGLRANGRFVVHGLDADPLNVEKAREYIQSKGLYGSTSINLFDGKNLPYTDDLVNLLVVSNKTQVSHAEMMRVLAPLGVLIDNGKKTIKPWPEGYGEWGHTLHGPDNNAVSQDTVAGEPRHIQWTAGPDWARHHDVVPSISACVFANGRMFSIEDRAPIGFSHESPDDWNIVARDAFNGIELWKMPIDKKDWGHLAWGGHYSSYGARYNHPYIAPRLVAVGNTVFVTPGMFAPISAYDAATGKVLHTYKGTELAEHILVRDGLIITTIKETKPVYSKKEHPLSPKNLVVVLDVKTGKEKWRAGPFEGIQFKLRRKDLRHIHISSNRTRVFCNDGPDIVALDLESGKEVWRDKREYFVEPSYKGSGGPIKNKNHILDNYCRIVAMDEVVLLAEQEDTLGVKKGKNPGSLTLTAYNSLDGKKLWTFKGNQMGFYTSAEVFVIDDLVWVVDKEFKDLLGLDLKTGKEVKRRDVLDAYENQHHQRCYMNRATLKYLTTNRRGMEFLPWDSDETTHTHWLRGGCRVGTFPCNGLVYGLPHPCDCYIASKLNGYIALAAKRGKSGEAKVISRLLKGPAYGKVSSPATQSPKDWPTYRHNPARSGGTSASVPVTLKMQWRTSVAVSGELTAPVVVDGVIYVASKNTQKISALDSGTGKLLWSAQLDSIIDSPPTAADGYVLCGTRGGWVHALRASDGKQVWRFMAAPEQRLIMDKGRLSSAWPVHGSVLAQNGQVCFTAGRSNYLDGGFQFYRLNIATGSVVEKEVITGEFGKKTDSGRGGYSSVFADYGVLSDVLVADAGKVYMRHRELSEGTTIAGAPSQFIAWGGLLDGNWFNRNFWSIDGIGHGQMMVYDDDIAYSVRAYTEGGTKSYYTQGKGYTYSAADRKNPEVLKKSKLATRTKFPTKTLWSTTLPLRAKSLVLTKEMLFAAGVLDTTGETPTKAYAHYRGERGGQLMVLAKTSGKKLAEYQLDSAPIHDGMAVVEGKVVISCKDGSLICFGE